MNIPLFRTEGNAEAKILALQMSLLRRGISTVIVAPDGTKRPFGKWSEFQQRLPTESELRQRYWSAVRRFRTHELGVAIICGVVSGGVEVIDFDDGGELFPLWLTLVQHIVDRLTIVRTPSGGTHIYFFCNEVCGNSKIACDPSREKQTLIETRGQGGYVVAPGSHARCHPSGKTYEVVSGPPLADLQRITTDERRQLWSAARRFDKRPSRVEQLVKKRVCQLRAANLSARPASNADEFIANFNRDASWQQILGSAGWRSRDGVHWTRPGKSDGTSAKIGTASDGTSIVTVFSSNAGSLSASDGHASFSKFSAYTHLHHNGDRIAALRELNPWTV